MTENEEVKVFELAARKKPLATIELNGYNILAGGPFGLSGQMRSFKLVNGDLVKPWQTGRILSMQDAAGREISIRIAALPVDEESAGLVEFV